MIVKQINSSRNKYVDFYLIGDLDALEFFLGNVADPLVISSFCLALLEYVLAKSRSGEVDLLLVDLQKMVYESRKVIKTVISPHSLSLIYLFFVAYH